MVREMGDRVKWTLGVTGQGVHRWGWVAMGLTAAPDSMPGAGN